MIGFAIAALIVGYFLFGLGVESVKLNQAVLESASKPAAKWIRRPGNPVRLATWVVALVIVSLTFLWPADTWIGGLRSEAISTAFAVIVLNELGQYRANLQEMQRIIKQLGSPVNDAALEALRLARDEGWVIDGTLKGARLGHANLRRAYLGNANLQGANLQWAILEEARLPHANLKGADLGGANLGQAFLMSANLVHVNLEYANLKAAYLANANLQGAVLTLVNLDGANLMRANLEGAILSGANLQGTHLEKTNLQGAILGTAHVTIQGPANLAFLEDTNLESAPLVKPITNLESAYLLGAR